MGLFSLFGRKNRQNNKNTYEEAEATLEKEDLTKYSNMRVEITATDGQVLFIAKLVNVSGDTAELYSYAEISDPKEDLGSSKFKIRGYDDKTARAVYLEGRLSPAPKHTWKVTDLTLLRTGNDRAFFRVDTNIDASVTSISRGAIGEDPCRLLNISIGGACILANVRYRKGEKLLLKVKLFEERDASTLLCKVLRVTEKDYLGFEYGCRFLEMNETEQTKIAQIIYDLQHKKIPTRTDSEEEEEKGKKKV